LSQSVASLISDSVLIQRRCGIVLTIARSSFRASPAANAAISSNKESVASLSDHQIAVLAAGNARLSAAMCIDAVKEF
jgi:hypothetical protein